MFQQLSDFGSSKSGFQNMSEDATARHTARQLYQKARRTAWRKALLGKAARHLYALSDALACAPVVTQKSSGMQVIPLDQIRGSEDRSTDFDIDFYPVADHLEERWVGLAAAALRGISLPPIEVIKLDDCYYVRDGHHRASLARVMGWSHIEAVVTEWRVG